MAVTVKKPERSPRSIIPPASMGLLAEVKKIVAENPDSVKERHALNGFTALHYAAKIGHRAMAEFLVGAGSDLYAEDMLGRWPVDIAYGTGGIDLIDAIERATYPENRETRYDMFDDGDDNDGGGAVRPLRPKPKP